jgi:ATP phosphoribosyltransferase regulatory subunit
MRRTIAGPPPGFRDLLFEEAAARRRVEKEFAAVFNERGYREIMPSSVESMEVYTRGHQGIGERTFRFLDREDNLLALRGDFTPSIARIVAGRQSEFTFPARVWYFGSVFRKADSHRGLYQEFSQVGAESIGTGSPEADAEILDIAIGGLTRAGVGDACVHVNHAGIFRGLVAALALDSAASATVKDAIDRKDMRALGERLDELRVDDEHRSQLHALAGCVGGIEVLGTADRALQNAEARAALKELTLLAKSLPQWRERMVFDLTEIDEMEYYTGLMYTFFSPSHSGELGKGGRYDDLLREFGADLPAVGFALSVDRVCACL